MRLRVFSVPAAARAAACVAVFSVLAGCADQDTYDNARVMDQSQQSSLGNPQGQAPIVAPPPLKPAADAAPRYEWNGNARPVIEGKAGTADAKRPVLKPQPPSSAISGSAAVTPSDAQVVEVQSGDTLHGIAGRYGVTVASLSQANRLSGGPLRVGQRLVLPATAR